MTSNQISFSFIICDESFKIYFLWAFSTAGLLQRRVQAPATVKLTSIYTKERCVLLTSETDYQD